MAVDAGHVSDLVARVHGWTVPRFDGSTVPLFRSYTMQGLGMSSLQTYFSCTEGNIVDEAWNPKIKLVYNQKLMNHRKLVLPLTSEPLFLPSMSFLLKIPPQGPRPGKPPDQCHPPSQVYSAKSETRKT